MAKMTMVQAINLALKQEMDKDDRVLVLGEDVGTDGGVFRVTNELIDKYGEERVIDTPLAETAIIGTSVGMALFGLRPVCEIQFSGFSYMAFHQLENHAARLRGRSCGRFHVPLVVRMPYGGGVRALEHHSESREVYYAHTPGIKMVIPSSPRNARALLISAIRDPDPVVFCELKESDGVNAEIIDLQTISPMDHSAFSESVKKTGRAVVVHEAPRSFGVAAEIAARLVEKSLLYLEAPVKRVTGFDVPIPLFQKEKVYLPGVARIIKAARQTLDF
ncbi:MAG: transketolase C-terminal domain-containing protein [Deltaproteobacteria bacterium]